MANPEVVNCPMGVWTKVFTAKTEGNVYLQTPDNDQVVEMTPVFCAWLDTASAAPEDLNYAIRLDDNVITFKRSASSDLYLYPVRKAISALVDA